MKERAVQSTVLFAFICVLGFVHETAGQDSAKARRPELPTLCTSKAWTPLETVPQYRGDEDLSVPIWQLPDSRAFLFVAGMTIDADGAPNAYSPDNAGLDELSNAGEPGHWNGIITGGDGDPLIQKESDPFPGYYISCTSLADGSKEFGDPTKYVDASKIPYVVLPREVAERGGARLGDFAVVVNLRSGKSSFAIYADIGTLGEGSIALADALGIRSNARDGGAYRGILYVVFPGSGNHSPRTMAEIESEGEKLVSAIGGIKQLYSCREGEDTAAASGQF